MKYVVVHRKDLNNVGDMASDPLQYFLKKEEYISIDINELSTAHIPEHAHLIVGGGGLIENQFFEEAMHNVLKGYDTSQLLNMPAKMWRLSTGANRQVRDEFFEKLNLLVKEYVDKLLTDKSKRIIWGAGHNNEDVKKSKGSITYPGYLNDYNLVGVRDYGQRFQWVPCASCMHPGLRKTYPIKNDIIWFEHKKQLIKNFGDSPIPRFINSGNNIDQTLELLGSTNTILTNSYHGAYWGTLLKKKVVIVDPWTSKFFSFKHQPAIMSKGMSMSDAIENAKVFDNALDECCDTTQKYWEKVKELTQ